MTFTQNDIDSMAAKLADLTIAERSALSAYLAEEAEVQGFGIDGDFGPATVFRWNTVRTVIGFEEQTNSLTKELDGAGRQLKTTGDIQ